jgi:phage shock protein PspC (stress-responsive transcriptional regulator)
MKKRLRRIKNHQSVLGGVSEGLGEYFGIDPVIFRIIFAVLFLTPYPSFITYLILWVVLPEEESSLAYADGNYGSSLSKTTNFSTMSNQSKNGNLVGGVILIVLGAIFAFRTFFDINLFHYIGKMWPLFLIGLGVWIIVRDKDDNNGFDSNNGYNDMGPGTGSSETF